MATNSTSPLPTLGPLYGALYFGSALSTAFYGVTCVQTFIYYVHYQNDPLRTKIFVAILCTLNTIHEALVISGTYKTIIGGLVNPLSITAGAPELALLFTAVVAAPSQGYFVHRIYMFSGKKITAPLIWVLLAILQLVSAAMDAATALRSEDGRNIEIDDKAFTTLGTLFLSVSAAADILIAISMTYLLLRSRTTTKFARMAHILQRLIMFSLHTGISTATFALVTLILLHLFPSTMLNAVTGIPVCAIYCNTALANLNVREYIMREESVNMDLFTLQSLPVSEGTRNDKRQGDTVEVTPTQQGIWKTTEVEMFADTD